MKHCAYTTVINVQTLGYHLKRGHLRHTSWLLNDYRCLSEKEIFKQIHQKK